MGFRVYDALGRALQLRVFTGDVARFGRFWLHKQKERLHVLESTAHVGIFVSVRLSLSS